MVNKYRVFTTQELEKLHDECVRLLGEKGCVFESEEAIQIFKENDFKVEGNVVYFSRAQIEKALETVPSKFELKSINRDNSQLIGGGQCLSQPSGGEVFMQDYKGARREGTLNDYINLTKLHHALPNIDLVGSSHIAVEDKPKRVSALYCTLELMKNTDKVWILPSEVTTGEQIEENFNLLELAFGKGYLENNYVTWQCVCPNSPLFYSKFAFEAISAYCKWNQPVQITSAPMAGITAPLSVWGVTLLSTSEVLAGLVLSQILRPGIPVIPTVTNIYGNMQRATWESGAPETALSTVAGIQMYKEIYNMPTRAIVGGTAAKEIDAQGGVEALQSVLLGALAGADVILEHIGTLDNLMAMSLEKTIIDEEIVARVKRILKGADSSEADMSFKAIMDTDFSGAFLTHKSTVKRCRKTYRPSVSDWDGYDGWTARGSVSMEDAAHEKVQQILKNAPESMIDEMLEKDVMQFIKAVEKKAGL